MDKTQKILITLTVIVCICIGAIMYTLSIFKNKNINSQGSKLEQGSGEEITPEVAEGETNTSNAEPEKNMVEELFIETELTINHLNREELYNKADLIVYGKIIEKENVDMAKDAKYPFTVANFEINQVIKGDLPVLQTTSADSEVITEKRKIKIKVPGGDVPLSIYIKSIIDKNPEEIAKKGYDKLTEKEKEGKYVRINYKYSNSFSKDEWYILMINGNEKDGYIVPVYTAMIPATETKEPFTKDIILKMPEVNKK